MSDQRTFLLAASISVLVLQGCGTATSEPVETTPANSSASTSITTSVSAPTTIASQALVGGGGMIAYEVRSNGGSSKLHLVDPIGNDPDSIGGGNGYLATWSPDGTRIAYLGPGKGGKNDLYAIDADGGNRSRLTNTPEEEGIPAWSPSGETIAVAIPKDGDADIYLLDPETGAVISQVTDNEGIDDYMPAWSPDGSQIAYVVRDGSEGKTEIHVMSADGTSPRQLTDNDIDDYYPAWSPHGDSIVFVSSVSDDQTLFTMKVDGSDRQQLTDGEDKDSRPTWSPDGSMIAYHVSSDGGWRIEMIEVATGNVTSLVDDGVHPAWSGATGSS